MFLNVKRLSLAVMTMVSLMSALGWAMQCPDENDPYNYGFRLPNPDQALSPFAPPTTGDWGQTNNNWQQQQQNMQPHVPQQQQLQPYFPQQQTMQTYPPQQGWQSPYASQQLSQQLQPTYGYLAPQQLPQQNQVIVVQSTHNQVAAESHPQDQYIRNTKVEKTVRERQAEAILALRKFFAHTSSLKIHDVNNRVNQLIQELKSAGLPIEEFKLRDFYEKIIKLEPLTLEEDQSQPTHTLLYNLVRESAAYDYAGPNRIFPFTLVAAASLAIAIMFPERAPIVFVMSLIALNIMFHRPLVNLLTRPAFQEHLNALNIMVGAVMADSTADEETRSFVRELCNRRSVPQVVQKHFPHIYDEQKKKD